jgi:hypothetical protein
VWKKTVERNDGKPGGKLKGYLEMANAAWEGESAHMRLLRMRRSEQGREAFSFGIGANIWQQVYIVQNIGA